MSCDVCIGMGRYPIINRYGRELYTIACPECGGSGMTEQEADDARQAIDDRQRYDKAMAEKRAALSEDSA